MASLPDLPNLVQESANGKSLQPDQSIQVWTTDIPVFAGDAVAKEIIIRTFALLQKHSIMLNMFRHYLTFEYSLCVQITA
jgi:hypothetical protein